MAVTNDLNPISMARLGGRRLWIQLAALTLMLVIALVLGREVAHHVKDLEQWITSHGWLGPVCFMLGVVLLASLFVPDSILAAIAGALFGVGGGSLLMITAMLCTAAVNFMVSRLFLHQVVDDALSRRPRLAAIHRAVAREGLRFQLLLRLTPINPVLMNYVLGTSQTRLSTFLLGCLGLIPALVVEVYFGHAAKHVAISAGGVNPHSSLHTVLTVCGLTLCVVVLVYITRIARKALAGYETTLEDEGREAAKPRLAAPR